MSYNTQKSGSRKLPDVVQLSQELIRFNTVNPPGNEAEAARYIGNLLSAHGFQVEYPVFSDNRLHVVAEKGLSAGYAPIVLSGHLDVVPVGKGSWKYDPFLGVIEGDKIYGRGASDMKGGVAAMICAAINSFRETKPLGGVRLLLTAGEELGCQGAVQLAKTITSPVKASAIIVGEPTANFPTIGHKGGLYLNASAQGKTAHSSMSELGDNAIYKVARAIQKIEEMTFDVESDPLLGLTTLNVGRMSGGMNINSVPDYAEFSIDIRSTGKVRHSEILDRLQQELGSAIQLDVLVDLPAVRTNEQDPFVELVNAVCRSKVKGISGAKALPYLTDGSVLQQLYEGASTIILGPGEPEQAHQTNEYCSIDKLVQAVAIYQEIIIRNGELNQ
ncbi:M20 family metallopeptidase [Sunxiuqinia elliptica]|uniref:Probable succinyl-diaminopimelate desuccinylase n=1 Tax=Sunxiuqinia elliptica TaxID=655355 RepID=A0A1I2GNS5_9BACT|nr:M20 family metallopeptidase [Sunxiuqinia elliptica]SFF18251.1 succinyl-diaminopimelate desuccinylase [Sunxiuqinia elliptica]